VLGLETAEPAEHPSIQLDVHDVNDQGTLGLGSMQPVRVICNGPVIIWLVVPLSLIGVTLGLVTTQNPFDFMAILGFLSLIGMLIKNAIVLIDEINVQLSEGKSPYDAVMTSATSRLRPVSMAASTTALGMIPLLPDPFYVAMAITIIFGLLFATGLTMIVVPTLYAVFYRVKATASE